MINPKFTIRIGTAGWSIPATVRSKFPQTGSVLEKYAQQFNAVEINSSFYRPHKHATYDRWALQVPQDFMFSVKLIRTITHESRLKNVSAPLEEFSLQVAGLGAKLGCVLVQLPPKLAFDKGNAFNVFDLLRQKFTCAIVCEPRHASWFTPEAEMIFAQSGVSRVAADPAKFEQASIPGGDAAIHYYRLHGTPEMYYSDYSEEALKAYAASMRGRPDGSKAWCIFDNTANGYATSNALAMQKLLNDS